MSERSGERLLAIVGPTASGKSALALQVAQEFSGEIICADSRTVYRGMDIGAAKPAAAERKLVPHHLLDVVAPNQPFSAAEFQRLANEAISAIHGRGNLPILVGGTGLYVDAVLYDYQFPAGASTALRAELQALPLAELAARLQRLDPERAAIVDLHNPRRVVRALELVGQPRIAPKALPSATHILGLTPGMDELERRIADRVAQKLADGLLDEVRNLIEHYSSALEAFNTVDYRETISYLKGDIKLQELMPLIELHERQLAKRQLTWFKRNPDIHWAATPDAALDHAKSSLVEAI